VLFALPHLNATHHILPDGLLAHGTAVPSGVRMGVDWLVTGWLTKAHRYPFLHDPLAARINQQVAESPWSRAGRTEMCLFCSSIVLGAVQLSLQPGAGWRARTSPLSARLRPSVDHKLCGPLGADRETGPGGCPRALMQAIAPASLRATKAVGQPIRPRHSRSSMRGRATATTQIIAA
jgi:hypothetical protein